MPDDLERFEARCRPDQHDHCASDGFDDAAAAELCREIFENHRRGS